MAYSRIAIGLIAASLLTSAGLYAMFQFFEGASVRFLLAGSYMSALGFFWIKEDLLRWRVLTFLRQLELWRDPTLQQDLGQRTYLPSRNNWSLL